MFRRRAGASSLLRGVHQSFGQRSHLSLLQPSTFVGVSGRVASVQRWNSVSRAARSPSRGMLRCYATQPQGGNKQQQQQAQRPPADGRLAGSTDWSHHRQVMKEFLMLTVRTFFFGALKITLQILALTLLFALWYYDTNREEAKDTWARAKEKWKAKWEGWKKGVDKTKDTPKKEEDGKKNDKQQQQQGTNKTDWWGIVNTIYRAQKEEDGKEKEEKKKKTKKKEKKKDEESKSVKDKALSKLRALRRSKKEESEK